MVARRKYSAEYKREAAGLTKSGTKPISQVAHDLGIHVNLLSRWCREMAKNEVRAFRSQGNPRDEELVTLKRELLQVKRERDFLKEAAAVFARESK